MALLPLVLAAATLLADVLPRDSIGPYVTLMLAGFAVGVLGHLSRSRWLVAIGVMMVFLAAALFPLAAYLTDPNEPSELRIAPQQGPG